MQHSQRLAQRLRTLREEVRTMTQEKERGEQVWRDRLRRCQRQLGAKEEEMIRQSQYFQNFKSQLQQNLSQAREREHRLQNRIHRQEKQLLDLTVSAATGKVMSSAVRITASSVTSWEEPGRLPSMREEGEGEEEKKEERRKQWQPSLGPERGGDDGKTAEEEECGTKESKQTSNEDRLHGFILSLQEDLRVLLERDEGSMTQRSRLMEQLQEAQEEKQFLCCKVEDMKAEVQQLRLCESSLMEEVEELREENGRLQQLLRDTANKTPAVPLSSGPRSSPAVSFPISSNHISLTTAMENPSAGNAEEMSAERRREDHSSSGKPPTPPTNGPQNQSGPSLQSLSLTAEMLDGFEPAPWCSRGILDLEDCPSVESDALREAYLSLGFGSEPEQLGDLKVSLQRTQEHLKMVAHKNIQLKIKLRKEAEEPESEVEQVSTEGKTGIFLNNDEDEDITEEDLVQALNRENGALADRIQELLSHFKIREDEETHLRENISKLELDNARLEQDNQEQGCLITELTKKTEDDLNAIMELQQRLEGRQQADTSEQTASASFHQNIPEEGVDSLVESVLKDDDWTTASVPGPQDEDHHDPLHVGSLTHEVDKMTKLVQSLKLEQKDLLGEMDSLREQQKEAAQSVRTQTEEKQQITRLVWGLKEEKDAVAQSLAGLRCEKEQLTRAVCGLKDERDQVMRSSSGLKEDAERLSKSLCDLEREKEKLLETLSEEKHQIMQSLQSLQRERELLKQTVSRLKEEKEKRNNPSTSLKEPKHQEKEDDEEVKEAEETLGSLKDRKGRMTLPISLEPEEEKRKLLLQSLTRERKIQIQQERNPSEPDGTPSSERNEGSGERGSQRCQTNSIENGLQERSVVMKEIEMLGAELEKSRDQLDQSQEDAEGLRKDLCRSEARRKEAESKAAQMAEEVVRLSDVARQWGETREENGILNIKVKELRSRLTALIGGKADALSLKAQIQEEHSLLKAELRAKTVALEELNSEFVALKKRRSSEDDLISLRTRYNDIRTKYDALLKKKSPTDLDMVPLKAKLSCLVLKCQERNCLLVQMMELLQRRGCEEFTLAQRVQDLLSDAALQEYTAAFTPQKKSRHYNPVFTQNFISKFQALTSDPTRSGSPALLHHPDRTGVTPESGVKRQDYKVYKHTQSTAREPDHIRAVAPAPTGVSPAASTVSASPATSTVSSSPVSDSPVPASPASASPAASTVSSSPAASTVSSSPVSASPVSASTVSVSPVSASTVSVSTASASPVSASPVTPEEKNTGIKETPSPPKDLSYSASGPHPPSSSSRSSPSRRLSSPEKIINLQEQLEKTLRSSYQVPLVRGRQQPRRTSSDAAPAELGPASKTGNLSLRTDPTNSLSPAENIPATTARPVSSSSRTLFNIVSSESSNVPFRPNIFSNHLSRTTKPLLSGSSDFLPATVASSKTKSTSRSTATQPTDRTSDMCPAEGPAYVHSPLRTTTDPDVSEPSEPSDREHEISDSHRTFPRESPSPHTDALSPPADVSPAPDGPVSAATCPPQMSHKSETKFPAALEKIQTSRSNPGAPAEVHSVEVIRAVGQRSLMIGWERPPLDELGRSNGTFVKGYRVTLNGQFHKSVLSSACTKSVLENVDLSVPVHIGVQTLGSNGLGSGLVHTVHRL